MAVARHYIMRAREGHDATLETALLELAGKIRAIPGCEGVEVLRGLGNERRFVLIEKWRSVEAHKAGGAYLPREALAPLMATLDGPPDGAYFEYLPAA